MKATSWKDIVELAGIAAIVASLVFVGLQLQQEQNIATVETYGTVAEAGINLSMRVGENMEIWQKALEGHELTAVEHGVFLGLFNSLMIHYQQNFVRWRRLGTFDPGLIASDLAYALYVFPGLKTAFEQRMKFGDVRDEARHRDGGLSMYGSSVLSSLAEYEKEQPAVPENRLYIFWDF
jgi:hypothetical protein